LWRALPTATTTNREQQHAGTAAAAADPPPSLSRHAPLSAFLPPYHLSFLTPLSLITLLITLLPSASVICSALISQSKCAYQALLFITLNPTTVCDNNKNLQLAPKSPTPDKTTTPPPLPPHPTSSSLSPKFF